MTNNSDTVYENIYEAKGESELRNRYEYTVQIFMHL